MFQGHSEVEFSKPMEENGLGDDKGQVSITVVNRPQERLICSFFVTVDIFKQSG